MSTERKRPTPLNPGGTWFLNPPEPRGNPTDYRGIAQLVTPAGGSTSIPSHVQLDVPGPASADPIFAQLTGSHVLFLRRLFMASATDPGSLALWSTDPVIEISGGFGTTTVPAWTLFFGELFTDAGRYADQGLWPGGDRWWLVSLYGRADAFSTAADVYQFVGPERDPAAIASPTTESHTAIFDALNGNRFEFVEPHEGGEPESGQSLLIPTPWYP